MVSAAVGDLDTMRAAAERAAATLSSFKGVRRRFELVGGAAGCRVYDDYAHHPTEVRAVIQGAKQRCGKLPCAFSQRLPSGSSSVETGFAATSCQLRGHCCEVRRQPALGAARQPREAAHSVSCSQATRLRRCSPPRRPCSADFRRHDGEPVWVVFQPHTLSRLRAFMTDFSRSFEGVARVIVTETYAARSGVDSEAAAAESLGWEQGRGQEDGQGEGRAQGQQGADEQRGSAEGGAAAPPSAEESEAVGVGPSGSPAQALAAAIAAHDVPVAFVPALDDVVERLAWELKGRSALDVEETVTIVTVGAGDVTSVGCAATFSLARHFPRRTRAFAPRMR